MTVKPTLVLSGGVCVVPEQVFPLHVGLSGVTVLAGSVVKTYELPLFGPEYVKVTCCPAGIVVEDAVNVIATTVTVADAVAGVVPEAPLACAM